jgi:hypothetical protein
MELFATSKLRKELEEVALGRNGCKYHPQWSPTENSGLAMDDHALTILNHREILFTPKNLAQ